MSRYNLMASSDSLDPFSYPTVRAKLSAFGLSLLVHALFGTALFVVGSANTLLTPKPKLMWLNLDNKMGSVPEAPPHTTPVPPKKGADSPGTAKAPERKKRKPRLKKKKRPRPSFNTTLDPNAVDLRDLSPNQAVLMIMLRMDRLRDSPHATASQRFLNVFYDHRALLRSSGLDPVRDFSAILVATPNPYRITQTFLAARHTLARQRVRQGLDASVASFGEQITWSSRDGALVGRLPKPPMLSRDARVVELRDGLLLLGQPDLMRELKQVTPAPGDKAKRRKEQPLTRALAALGETSNKAAPALVVHASNLSRLVMLPRGVPTPLDLRVTAPATDPVVVRATARFGHKADAYRFRNRMQAYLAEGNRSVFLAFLGFGSIVGRIKLSAKGRVVSARLRLRRTELGQLLDLLRNMIPQAPLPPSQNTERDRPDDPSLPTAPRPAAPNEPPG